ARKGIRERGAYSQVLSAHAGRRGSPCAFPSAVASVRRIRQRPPRERNTMTAQITTGELREDYLRCLDAATGDLPHRLAVELHAGIAEELQGLAKAATAQRIAE